MSVKELRVVSVGVEDGLVKLWALPMWLKSDQTAIAHLTPRRARELAVQLIQAAESAE